MSIFNIIGRSASGKEPLCNSCINGRTVRGFRAAERVVFCRRDGDTWYVPFPVHECDGFEAPGESVKPVRRIGFVERDQPNQS